MATTNKHRLTVGFLIDHTDRQYQFGILQGISDFAKTRDVNLICFEGGKIEGARPFDHEQNVIYDLAMSRRLDGVIVLSDAIATCLDDDSLLEFCKVYDPLPVISVGRGHKEIPSIVIDSTKGMRELTEHLAGAHGYRSFAFIKGPAGSHHAEVRYRTFVDTLVEYGIEVDGSLVVEGDYLEPSGREAVQRILQASDKLPEVIVACNDEMAIGALNELRSRGISSPDDIAVVGFDDILKSASADPPLTTVRQPLIQEGWTAMELLVGMIERVRPPMKTELDSAVIVRDSCGCAFTQEDIGLRSNSAPPVENDSPEQTAARHGQIEKQIQSVLGIVSYDRVWLSEEALAAELIAKFRESLAYRDVKIFTSLWRQFLDNNLHLENDEVLCRGILERLYHLATDKASRDTGPDTLFHIAEGVLKDKAMLEIYRSFHKTFKENWIVNRLRDELDIRLSNDQIVDILESNLKALGIATAYLAMYDDDPSPEKPSRLVLAYEDGKRRSLPPDGIRFPARDLVPGDLFNTDERFSFVVESIDYANQQIGFLILDMSHHINSTYGTLRRIISSIFHGTHLVQKIEHQRSERDATIDRLRKTMSGVIKTLSLTVETRDPYTAGHQRRVSDLSRAIAQKMGLPRDLIEGIRVAGNVHDLGKIFTPLEILNKPGNLMDIEFNLIKHHPEAGYNILKNIEFPWPIADIVLQHHERCDGSGFPQGLKKDDILLQARILAVADVVEAITSRRPYRAALGLDAALEEISKHRGTKYDEDAVDACLSLFSDDGYVMPTLASVFPVM